MARLKDLEERCRAVLDTATIEAVGPASPHVDALYSMASVLYGNKSSTEVHEFEPDGSGLDCKICLAGSKYYLHRKFDSSPPEVLSGHDRTDGRLGLKIGAVTRAPDPKREPESDESVDAAKEAIFQRYGVPKSFAENKARGLVVQGFFREKN